VGWTVLFAVSAVLMIASSVAMRNVPDTKPDTKPETAK
jgi:hypothetical protein